MKRQAASLLLASAYAAKTRASCPAGACNTPATRVAGALRSPSSLARSASSDGSSASALTPATSSSWVPSAPPTRTNLSLVLAKSTATFATATGSADQEIAVGPFSRGAIPSNRVPSRASKARRFFATLKLAPAARIFRRSSVTSATVIPALRVTTTIDVSANTVDSSATNSRFSMRSTSVSNLRQHSNPSAPPGYPRCSGTIPEHQSPVLQSEPPNPLRKQSFWHLVYRVRGFTPIKPLRVHPVWDRYRWGFPHLPATA